MYISVLLKTATGGKVGFFRIPKFQTGNPPILIWGDRVFMRDRQDPSLYVESVCFVMPDTQTPMESAA